MAGRKVLAGADTNALPLEADTGLEHAYAVPGVMHACCHDAHAAALLGAAPEPWGRRFQPITHRMFAPQEDLTLLTATRAQVVAALAYLGRGIDTSG